MSAETKEKEFALSLRAAVRDGVAGTMEIISMVIRALWEGHCKEVEPSGGWREDQVVLENTTDELPGWALESIQDANGRLEHPMELRFHGVLFAQAWESDAWAVGHYIEGGENLHLDLPEVRGEPEWATEKWPLYVYVDWHMVCATFDYDAASSRGSIFGTAKDRDELKKVVEDAEEEGLMIYGWLRQSVS